MFIRVGSWAGAATAATFEGGICHPTLSPPRLRLPGVGPLSGRQLCRTRTRALPARPPTVACACLGSGRATAGFVVTDSLGTIVCGFPQHGQQSECQIPMCHWLAHPPWPATFFVRFLVRGRSNRANNVHSGPVAGRRCAGGHVAAARDRPRAGADLRVTVRRYPRRRRWRGPSRPGLGSEAAVAAGGASPAPSTRAERRLAPVS